MPTYVYQCDDNGHQFEAFQSITADPLTECEVCGHPVRRLLFAPAIHFKGPGFHNTDYGTRRRPVGGDSEGGSGEGSSSGDGSGSGDTSNSAAGASSDSGSGSASGSTKTVGLDKA